MIICNKCTKLFREAVCCHDGNHYCDTCAKRMDSDTFYSEIAEPDFMCTICNEIVQYNDFGDEDNFICYWCNIVG